MHLESYYFEINCELRTVLGIPSLQDISVDQSEVNGLKNTYIKNKYYLDSKENVLKKQYFSECDSNWIYVILTTKNIIIKQSDNDFDINNNNNNNSNIDNSFRTPTSKSIKIKSLIKNTSILFKTETKMLFEIGKLSV